MVDLLDERAERIGVTFQRNKTINSFPTATAAHPHIVQVLFAMTRPAKELRKKRLWDAVAEAAATPPEPSERIELPKGMVQYKREFYGPRDRN